MSTEQALRKALERILIRERSVCDSARCVDSKHEINYCRYAEARAALALTPATVALEYRVAWEVQSFGKTRTYGRKSERKDAAGMAAEYRENDFCLNVRIEARVAAGPWLPVEAA